MHHAALRTAPQALPDLEKHMSKNGRKVVAVEKHNVDWSDASIEINEQFLWIKARDVSCLLGVDRTFPVSSSRFFDLGVTASYKANIVTENHSRDGPRGLHCELR